MSDVNKHLVLQNWVSQFLTDNFLSFQSADAVPQARIIAPQYGDYVIKTDILGSKYKVYTFVFIGYETTTTGSGSQNTDNMQIFDNFNKWLEEQQDTRNFPNFGSNCSDYEISPLQNMANLATIDDAGLAKYMLAAKVNYKED